MAIQQGAQVFGTPGFQDLSDWFKSGIQNIKSQVEIGALGVFAIGIALPKAIRIPKSITYAVPSNNPDCRQEPNEAPTEYNGPEINPDTVKADRTKAVLEAWLQEIEYIAENGTGTRIWTAEQLKILKDAALNKDLIITIRAEIAQITTNSLQQPGFGGFLRSVYGKIAQLTKGISPLFRGHHINSVARNPNLAGDPNNITFVEKDKHIDDCHGMKSINWTLGKLFKRK
jgi:hypothetical protein